jgi:lysophospholipase L1-like esterase
MRRWLLAVGSILLISAGAVAVFSWQRKTTRGAITSTTVVMLGDSITEEGDWGALLPGHDVANRGYPGFTTEELVEAAEAVAEAEPAVVFVLTGTNDIRDGRTAGWTEAQLSEMLDHFDRVAPETSLVLQTILPRADAPDQVAVANESIRQIASDRGIPVLDLHPAFDNGAGGLRPSDTTDGIHLADPGYRRWAGLVAELLASADPVVR